MFHRLRVVVFLFVSLLVAAAPDAAAQPAPGGSLIALAQNLKVEVTETGPEQLWTLHLSNLGDFPIGLVADPGLLWFQVEVPGRSTPQTCRLPGPLWPKTMRRRAQIVLEPGQRFSRRFDARFFCFADLTQTVLVPGARVAPFFGWPLETREVRVRGKRTTETLPATAPFVAWALQPPEKTEGDAPEESTATAAPADDFDAEGEAGERRARPDNRTEPPSPPAEGLKHISGATFVLSPAYARWSQPLPELPPGLHTLMLAGSDAEDERNVTITMSVLNTSDVPQQVFVRRDLVSFDVTGPDGTFHCPTTDLGPPDMASFTTLAPRRSERFVVRLIEICPRGSFSRPGLYEVHAALEAKYSGQSVGFDAFVGTLAAPRPALVRVRSGDRSSFLRPTPLLAGVPGGTAPGPAGRGAPPMNGSENDAPVEGAPDAPPPEEVPADPSGAAPEEGPAPQSPADGTLVE